MVQTLNIVWLCTTEWFRHQTLSGCALLKGTKTSDSLVASWHSIVCIILHSMWKSHPIIIMIIIIPTTSRSFYDNLRCIANSVHRREVPHSCESYSSLTIKKNNGIPTYPWLTFGGQGLPTTTLGGQKPPPLLHRPCNTCLLVVMLRNINCYNYTQWQESWL